MVVDERKSDKNQSSISCDNVIITATAKAVSFMEFVPPLAYSKKHALDNLFYFDSVKIFLVFSRPFWSEPNNLPIIAPVLLRFFLLITRLHGVNKTSKLWRL